MKDMMAAMERRMQQMHGIADSRSKQGIMARGKNIYKGGLPQANTGPLKPPPLRKVIKP